MCAAGEKIRVLIVDDHAVVRQGLRTFLELQDTPPPGDPTSLPIEVVGEAVNGREAVEAARHLQPDIVLLDLVMPEMDGLHATPAILESSPTSRIIILTSFGEEDKVLPAVRAGAQGYLLKDIAPAELARSVREVYRGRVQLHPDAAQKLMNLVASSPASAPTPRRSPLHELTERELETLRLVATGLSNREIAEKLVISEKTVKTHVSSMLSKLGLEDRTQAAIYAIKHGLSADET